MASRCVLRVQRGRLRAGVRHYIADHRAFGRSMRRQRLPRHHRGACNNLPLSRHTVLAQAACDFPKLLRAGTSSRATAHAISPGSCSCAHLLITYSLSDCACRKLDARYAGARTYRLPLRLSISAAAAPRAGECSWRQCERHRPRWICIVRWLRFEWRSVAIQT